MKSMLAVFAVSIMFCLAIVQGVDESESANSVNRDTPNDNITFNLPDGYYLYTEKPFFGADGLFLYDDGKFSVWIIQAYKNGTNGEEKAYSLTIEGYNESFSLITDEFRDMDVDKVNTTTKTGQTALIALAKGINKGRYSAFLDLSNGKVIHITLGALDDSTIPQAGMTVDEFKEFIESISIE